MRRACFTPWVKPEHLHEYRGRHTGGCPELLQALRVAGWHDYSIFLRDDGLEALAAAQQAGDLLAANSVLMDAYDTDVRPLLRQPREDMGLDPDPVGAYQRSGYADKIRAERAGGQAAGWGA